MFSDHTQPFLWASWLPVFWTVHLISWLSLRHLVLFFLELWSVLSFGVIFFLSLSACYIVRGEALAICQSGATHFTGFVMLYVREGSEREYFCLLGSHPTFSHFPHFPQAECALSSADSWVGGLVYILGSCGPLQWTLLWDWEFLPPLQPPQDFTARGIEALVSCAGTLSCVVCLALQFLLAYPHVNVGYPSPPAAALSWVLPHWLLISTPPTNLDECFFNGLVVGRPYSLIFLAVLIVFCF